ncbi:MAG: EAL domain-containing protein [Gammaproteobacteria bacterium]
MFHEACRIAVEHGFYHAAGIRRVNKTTGEAVFVAGAGPAEEIAARMPITLSGSDEKNHGPTGLALREGRQVIVNQLSTDPGTRAFLDVAGEYGIQSVAAFPLVINNDIAGIMTFYSRDPGAFDEDEVALLEELAADTSLGLNYIAKDQQLAYLSFHDALTDLPNRALALDRINQATSGYGYRTIRITGIVVLSIENYRKITNAYGTATADKVLREVATFLIQILRDGDTVARIDAHDFGIVLTGVFSVNDLNMVVQKLLDSLPGAIMYRGEELVINYRAGISIHPRDGKDGGELLRRAGLALTGARKIEQPFRYYTKDLEDQNSREYALEKDLRDAVNNNELELYYQPIITVRDRELVGFEALSRWQNSRLGWVPPAEFIPIAENTGLIESICYWSVEKAVRQLQHWEKDGIKDIYVAINISPYQLRSKGIANRILEIIHKAGADRFREQIVLEITESMLMEHSDSVIAELNILQDKGLKLFVDDFGTGYSSLSYLRRFPVDTVKIDSEFINGLPHDHEAEALVKGIIGMAHGIGLEVVAEGVETEEQYAVLCELGCDLAQGYLFSRAVPPEEVALSY